MNCKEILIELQKLGTEQTKKTFLRHGASEPLFGVKVGDLKVIQKRIKKDYLLAKELFATGNSDAMYLAGLISDPAKMTKDDLNEWAHLAKWNMISEYAVAWTAAESPLGYEIALSWINSSFENVASAGWATLGSWVSITDNSKIPMAEMDSLLEKVKLEIHTSPNRVKYTMNGFVIAVGAYIESKSNSAIAVGKEIGEITIEMGNTSCKIPNATAYIQSAKNRGSNTKKKKTAKC